MANNLNTNMMKKTARKITKRSPKQTLRRHVGHLVRYLSVVLILIGGILVNTTWMRSGQVLGYASNTTVGGLLAATNQERANNGLGALSLNGALNQAAASKAADMANRDYWSHNTPEGATPWTFVTAAGYSYQMIAENLAYGFADSNSTVAGWMNSPGHRANILNGSYVDVGFATANSANYQGTGPQTVVVAFYGLALGASAPAPTAPAPPPPAPAPAPAPAPVAPTPAPAPEPTTPPPAVIEPEPVAPTEEAESTEESSQTPTPAPVESQPVSRLDMLNINPGILGIGLAVSGVSALGVGLAARHVVAWRRMLVHGEQLILHHPVIDIAIVGTIVAAVVLVQTIGFIR